MGQTSRLRRIAAITFVALAASLTTACATAPQKTANERPQVRFDDMRLANGLRVITMEDHRAPIVTVAMMVNAGSANEQPSHTGFAHMFEHLMFQGSANVAPGEHSALIAQYGGNSNATTATDWTYYFDSVPSNQVDLSLFLNSDRLRSLAVTTENFTKEKEVVKEEKRLRVDNQPYRHSGIALNRLMYDSFAYGHEGVGSMADLDAASLQDIQQFFDTYYAANNVTLVMVGDVDVKSARAKAQKYFGDLPRRAAPPPLVIDEPRQMAARRQLMPDPLAPAPRVSLAFKTVPTGHADYYPLQVLASTLGEGRSARLYDALLKQRELATSVNASLDDNRGPSGLFISADVRASSSPEAVEQAIYDEIARIQKDGIADWELEKGKSAATVEILNLLRRGVVRALYVSRTALYFDDPGRVNADFNSIAAVTAADVQRVAREYLRESNRTVVITQPAKNMGEAK